MIINVFNSKVVSEGDGLVIYVFNIKVVGLIINVFNSKVVDLIICVFNS